MSYSIIFETIIVKLADGRIMHLDRSGCNNDNAGRTRDDFTAKIYTEEEFLAKANGYKENRLPYSKGGDFDLKIIGRNASLYDYGEHLLRMYRRAMSWVDTIDSRYLSRIRYCEDVDVIVAGEEPRVMPVKEFSQQFYKLLYGGKGLSYHHNWIYVVDIRDEKEVVGVIESNNAVQISIGAINRYRNKEEAK